MSDFPPPGPLVEQLVDLLTVDEIDTDLYRGARQPGGVGRVFGGQVVAQALQAAQRSTDLPKTAHSLHAYFMRPGSEDVPIIYRVVRDFDGRSFATRRVIAIQRGKPILSLTASFQTPEDGFHHQDAMPDVPLPDALPAPHLASDPDLLPPIIRRQLPIEFRLVAPSAMFDPPPSPPIQQRWFRLRAPIGDDPALHRAVLAYISDFGLIGTALLPHGARFMQPGLQVASLDHALWLHEPFRVDDWLLYDSDSPWAGHARGFTRGRFFTADGRLVASVAQEGLIRQHS